MEPEGRAEVVSSNLSDLGKLIPDLSDLTDLRLRGLEKQFFFAAEGRQLPLIFLAGIIDPG